MWALAGGVGPILGGALSELATWRWIFWINLPVSGTAFVLLLVFLDVHNPRTKVIEGVKAIDWFGSLSMLGFTLMLLLGLDFGGTTFAWSSPTVICLIVFGCVMSIFFVFSEKRLASYPLMPLGLFRRKSNVASLLVAFLHGFVSDVISYVVKRTLLTDSCRPKLPPSTTCHSTSNLSSKLLRSIQVFSYYPSPSSKLSLALLLVLSFTALADTASLFGSVWLYLLLELGYSSVSMQNLPWARLLFSN